MEKECQLCCAIKPIDNFPQYNVKGIVGYRKYCKECYKTYKKNLYELNLEKNLLKQKEYRTKNHTAVRKRDNEYKKKNRDILRNKQKEYVKNNVEKIKEYKRNWEKDKIINDPLFRCKKSIMNLIRTSFKRKGLKKSNKTNQILGCTYEEFKVYLESKFEPWMNWDNYGLYNGTPNYGWDIDHIIPVSSATTEEELIKLNHFTNLQPLCSYINRYVKKDNLFYQIKN